MPQQVESEWFPSAPLATASTSSSITIDESEITPPITKKLNLIKNLSLPPYANSNLLVMSNLTRSSSCRSCPRKVTWEKNSSSESLSSKFTTYQYSVGGGIILREHRIDSVGTCCCHLLKLICLVLFFMAAVFFIQCLMYFIYTVVFHSATTGQYAKTSIDASEVGQKNLRDVFGLINESYFLIQSSQ